MDDQEKMPSEERIKELEAKYPNLFADFQGHGVPRELIGFSVDNFEKLNKEELYAMLIDNLLVMAALGIAVNIGDALQELLSGKPLPTA